MRHACLIGFGIQCMQRVTVDDVVPLFRRSPTISCQSQPIASTVSFWGIGSVAYERLEVHKEWHDASRTYGRIRSCGCLHRARSHDATADAECTLLSQVHLLSAIENMSRRNRECPSPRTLAAPPFNVLSPIICVRGCPQAACDVGKQEPRRQDQHQELGLRRAGGAIEALRQWC
jgi:hypothetical protein